MFVRQLTNIAFEGDRWVREIASLRAPGIRLGRLQIDPERVFVLTCPVDAVSLTARARSSGRSEVTNFDRIKYLIRALRPCASDTAIHI